MTSSPDPALLVIECFIDGEAVDLEALRVALSRSDAREHLVELLALREAVWATAPRRFPPGQQTRTPLARGIRWFAVAAGVLLTLTTGFVAGQERAARSTGSPGVEAIMDLNAAPPPQPTHVIALRPGVNWTETAGGR